MTRENVTKEYFEWMCKLVFDGRYLRRLSYRKLLTHLHNREFIYILGIDGNRAEDGINLRYRFGHEQNYSDAMIADYLDTRPCSMFEMMVALALRCEDHIMDDPDVGNRTGQWFWNMIVNLGLSSMTDSKFDKRYTDEVLEQFINREYARNGEGGLFVVHHCQEDMRSMEIWYQMCRYLEEVLKS